MLLDSLQKRRRSLMEMGCDKDSQPSMSMAGRVATRPHMDLVKKGSIGIRMHGGHHGEYEDRHGRRFHKCLENTRASPTRFN